MVAKEIQAAADRVQKKLADAYLELLDETSIDEEWAATQQAKYGVMMGINQFGWHFDSQTTPRILAGSLKTRGQLRALLLAMGVER